MTQVGGKPGMDMDAEHIPRLKDSRLYTFELR